MALLIYRLSMISAINFTFAISSSSTVPPLSIRCNSANTSLSLSYHYHSDCHCRFSSKLNFRSGILARSPYIQWKSHGVPTFGLFIRTNVLSACLFNFQGTVKGEIPCGEITPSLIPTGRSQMHPLNLKKIWKNFFALENCPKTQKSRLFLRKETSGITAVLFRCIARSSFSFVLL